MSEDKLDILLQKTFPIKNFTNLMLAVVGALNRNEELYELHINARFLSNQFLVSRQAYRLDLKNAICLDPFRYEQLSFAKFDPIKNNEFGVES